MRAPDDVARRPVRIVSNVDRWAGAVASGSTTASVGVCVPPRGYTEIQLTTPVASSIPPDASTPDAANGPR